MIFAFPENWPKDKCVECKQNFKPDPRCNKQVLCSACRTWTGKPFSLNDKNHKYWIVESDFLFKPYGLYTFGTINKIAKAINYSVSSVGIWNKSGRIPGMHGAPKALCQYLGLTRELILKKMERVEFTAYRREAR
jgi:hypothetical protein